MFELSCATTGIRLNFDGRRPLVEDDIQWKTTFGGRRPSVEDDPRGKKTFGGRRPLVENDLRWGSINFCTPNSGGLES